MARRIVLAVVAAYFILSTLYNLAVPVGEAPDEPAHIDYVRIILRTGQFPTIPLGSPRYSYEAEQPPLYYLLGAGWMGLLWPNSNILPSLSDNPDFSFAKETPYNAYLHTYPAQEDVPAHLLRLLSTLLGLGTLALIWLSAQEAWYTHPGVTDEGTSIAPHFPTAALIATGFVALLPGFTFTSGTVTNDTLAALAGACIVYLTIRIIRRGATLPLAALAGITLGLALLSKWSLAVFAPLPVLACLLAPGTGNRWRAKVVHIAMIMVIALVIGGWPFLSNLLEYGDPLATQARLAVKSPIVSPLANMPFFWLNRGYVGGLFDSLWGVFGLRNLQLPSAVYVFYYLMLVLGLTLSLYSLRKADSTNRKVLTILALTLALIYAGVAYQNTQFWAIQGRLLLPGLGALALLIGWGTTRLFEMLRLRPRTLVAVTSLLMLGLLILNFYALMGTLIVGYYG